MKHLGNLGETKALLQEATKRVRTVADRKWIPDWMRREGVDSNWVENTRQRLVQWMSTRPVEDTTLLLDGPGYGCPQGLVALAMLGTERMLAMREVHAFSASTYQVLFQLARSRGDLTVPEWDASRWNRENQWRHDVRPGSTLIRGLSKRLRRRQEALFPDHLGEAAMANSVAESFVRGKVASLPPSLRFWVYNRTQDIFEPMGAGTRFDDLRIGDLVRACTSVPHLYSPFRFEGDELVDPLWGKDIRPLYRQLRLEAKHAIFGHMQRDGVHENTLFVKLHPDTNGYRRIGLDFAYFVLGLDNREIGEAIRLGLFEIAPISERELSLARLLPPA